MDRYDKHHGFLGIAALRGGAFNESAALQQSAESCRKSYGQHPAAGEAETIFHAGKNQRFCKEHRIHRIVS